MASTNKTNNLKLNSWIGTDKPQRTDFVSDNSILDKVIGQHLTDTDMHLTEDLLTRLYSDFEMGMVDGNGEEYVNDVFEFSPKFVVVYQHDAPWVSYDSTNGCMICNSGIVYRNGVGNTPGLGLSSNRLLRRQSLSTPNNGIYFNLNESGKRYVYIAFK